jgi:hypothetical protein
MTRTKCIWETRFPKGSDKYNLLRNKWRLYTNYRVLQLVMNTLFYDELNNYIPYEEVELNLQYIKEECRDFFTENEYYGIVIPYCEKYKSSKLWISNK